MAGGKERMQRRRINGEISRKNILKKKKEKRSRKNAQKRKKGKISRKLHKSKGKRTE
jgi:hypothetical protein